jgi:hypothetical protein
MEQQLEENLEEENDLIENCPYPRPRIFNGHWQENIPPGFDALTITLDGRTQADLDWKNARKEAQCAVEKGYALMWDMQLGLFDRLAHPLTNQTQFLSLTLSLEHFRDSLWKEFKSQTIGISLLRGSVDFSRGFSWDSDQKQSMKEWLQEISDLSTQFVDFNQLELYEEGQQLIRLFCRDVAVEYLALLASRLPDSLRTYLYLDASPLAGSILNEIQLLNPERFDRLHLALKNHHLPFDVLGWEAPTFQGYSGHAPVELPLPPQISIGVCIPPLNFYHSHHYQGLEEGLLALIKRSIPFKIIAESQLTSSWDGLDYILYAPSGLSGQGKRKLQGFCAAGGTVVSTGVLLGLPHEMGLEDWLKNPISYSFKTSYI